MEQKRGIPNQGAGEGPSEEIATPPQSGKREPATALPPSPPQAMAPAPAPEGEESTSIRLVAMASADPTEGAGATDDTYIGALIDGRYQVEARLGEGGMGVVYRCRHTFIDKPIAMKVLRADMARNEEVTERFLNEARTASSIGNPHIIDIQDFGRLPDGATYFTMEFLDGQSLANVLEDHGQIPATRLTDIAHQMAEALGAAHRAGIIHRDLKPDNVFLVTRGTRDDFVKILDFGIAKASTANSRLTQAGQVFGTPHYMSPEQAAGTPVDPRSDIYAMGVMLFEMATGQLPFDGENFMAVLTQHMYRAAPRIHGLPGLREPVAPELEALILKCLEKDPAKRFQSMEEVGRALEAAADGQILDAYGRRSLEGIRPSAIPGAPSQARRRLMTWAAIVLAIFLALSGGWILARMRATQRARQISRAQEAALQAVRARAPSSQVASAAPPPPATTPENHQVVLAVIPADATILRGTESLGPSPVALTVGNAPIELTIQRAGYQTRTLLVDGRTSRMNVTLVKAAAKGGNTRPARPQAEGIVPPW